MKRKGISPVISAVLLVAVVISVVSVYSGWAPNLVKQLTQQTENQTLNKINCDKGSLNIISASYNSSDLEVAVRNSGSTDLPEVIVAAFGSDGSLLGQNTDLNLTRGNLNSTTLTGLPTEPSYVEAFSTSCGSITDRMDQIN